MQKISSPGLAQLLMQLRYTPVNKRRRQLDAAEKLFTLIDKDKEYPFEFVCFRITGFHLKSSYAGEIIKGSDLLDDLRTFIARLSNQLAQPVGKTSEKIYTNKQLADNFDVSVKSIYRWRKRGLIAEKYIFPDGQRRLGFLQSTIDKFAGENPELISKAGNFTRMTARQKRQIVAGAARLAAKKNLSRSRIIKKLGRQTGRSNETIRYILVDYQKANPDKNIFKKSPGVIEPARAAEIYRLYKQGCSISELIRRFERNKSSIYRIINVRRAKELLARKIEFIACQDFSSEGAGPKILKEPVSEQLRRNRTTARIESEADKKDGMLKLADNSLPEYLQVLQDVPMLNREQESELFRRYNYLKYLACKSRDKIKLAHILGAELSRAEGYLSQAEEIKQRIIEANLRLVVTVARKHTGGAVGLPDLVSEGNVSLMQAVEKFDYNRGYRFATFASWAIAKDYAGKLSQRFSRLDKATAASLANIQRDLQTKQGADFAAIERAHRSLIRVIKDNLTEREQYIIINRYGLLGTVIKKKTKTLVQIGQELGLSKERIRQIELTALQKLRQSLSIEEFELLTGA
jgi:RNA polymerase primary sigma factor